MMKKMQEANPADMEGEMYMKKILSLIMALMLLALCPAMAETVEETAVQTQTLVSPNGDYSFDVPLGYIPMDAEVMLSLFQTEEMQQLLARAMGLEDASQLAMYFEKMEASNMMIVYSSNMQSNLNVQTAESILTMDVLVMLKSAMDDAMIEQYVSMGVAEEDIHPMDIQEIGEYRWYGMQLAMAGIPMQIMITVENGVQYTMVFTAIDEVEMLSILESFKVAEVAAE